MHSPSPPLFSETASSTGFVLKYFTSTCFVKNFVRKGKKINHARVCMLITRNWLFNATDLRTEGGRKGCLYDETFFLPFALNGPSFSAEDEARFQTS